MGKCCFQGDLCKVLIPQTVLLTQVYRQEEREFIGVINETFDGSVSKRHELYTASPGGQEKGRKERDHADSNKVWCY